MNLELRKLHDDFGVEVLGAEIRPDLQDHACSQIEEPAERHS